MKIDIFSGFLGSGKTTLIKKLIAEAYCGEKVVLIENEFGEIGIDGGFLKESGINITEMNSGCICCSLVGDFADALKKVTKQYSPDRIIIEPSGVGKLSDVTKAVIGANIEGATINSCTTVVDANKCKMYMKNFGEFFINQVENASCIVLSHTDVAKEEKIAESLQLIRSLNEGATVISTPLNEITGKQILDEMEHTSTLEKELKKLTEELHHHDDDDDDECCHEHHHHDDDDDDECCHEHHHHDDDDDDECCHEHHHHDDDDDECRHEHHHHDDDDDECCHEHHHHDDDDDDECCHEHHHHHDDDDDECCHGHHHHHHADEVFTSWGRETTNVYTMKQIQDILNSFAGGEYGTILRAKGIVEGEDGWIHFDYIPDGVDVRHGAAGTIGKICVIGCKIDEEKLATLFNVK